MNKCDIDKIHSKYTKNNRLIYSISRQLSINEIEEIVRKCEVDFFSIDTVMFENVKIYYTMINQIRDACEKYNKIIGIIAELCGRKIKVYNIYIDGDSTDDMVDLQKGEIVKIKWTGMRPKKSEKKNSQKTIYVNFRDLDDLVSIEDEIIINDNRGCLKVIEKKEKEVKLLDRVRHKSTTKHKTHYYSSRMNNKQLENIKLDNSNNIENQNINNSSRKSKVGTSSYDHINSNGKKIEKMFDLDEKLRSQFKHDNQNYFIRKSSFIFTNQIVEKIEDNSKEIPHNNTIDTRSFRVKSDSRSSVIKYLKCEVKYDCKISKNSFLFVPNADYKSLGIDLLSSREVNEINHLNNMGVHFICITIKDMDDIDSIKEVLSQDSKIRIIANIPDFATLQHIDDILQNTSGLVLSRTFGIKCHKHFDITRLTKALISKCKEFSKPIFTYIEVDSDFNTKKRFIMNDVMFNINDGMDGFFIGFNNNLKMITDPFSYSIDILNYFAYIFKTIQIDRNIIRMSIGDKKKANLVENSSSSDILNDLLSKYDKAFENCCYAYVGDHLDDIQQISKINMRSPCFVFSDDKNFLNYCQLCYSVFPILLNKMNEKNIKDLIRIKFGLKGAHVIQVKSYKNNKRKSVKVLI